MPTYDVTGPNGEVYEVNAPPGATEKDAITYAQTHHMTAMAGSAPAAPAARPAPAPIFDPLRDFGSAVMGAGRKLGADVTEDYQAKIAALKAPLSVNPADFLSGTLDNLRRTARMVGDVGGMIASPMAGAVDAAISGPGGRLISRAPIPQYGEGAVTLKGGLPQKAIGPKLTPDQAAQRGTDLINMALTAARPAPGFKVPTPAPRAAPPAPIADRQAMNYVDTVASNSGVTPDMIRAAPPEITGAEALGKGGKSAIGALARREGATGDALAAEVTARQEGRPGRILDAFATASGVDPDAAAGNIRSLVDEGRAKAAPLYQASEATPMQASPRLLSLAERKPVKAAMDQAMNLLESDVTVTPEQLAQIRQNPSASSTFWDYTHRALNDAAGEGIDPLSGRSKNPNATRVATGLAKEFGAALREAHPPLGAAMDTAGDYLSAEQAFRDAGKDIFNGNLTETQLADKLAKMAPSEQDAYRAGVANRFYDLAQTSKLDPKVLKTPRVRAKLATVLGEDKAAGLIDLGSQEGDMQAFERRYAPDAGSITQDMKAAMDAQDAVGGPAAQMGSDFVAGLHQGPKKAAGGAIGRQLQALFDQLGPTRGMSVPARDVAGRTLMLPPADLAKALEAYRQATASSSKRAALLRLLPLAGAIAPPVVQGAVATSRAQTPSP